MSSADPAHPASPRVSVLVPCYNHAAFVGRTIASIILQQRPPDELVVIDDGSGDDSAKVTEKALRDCPFPCELISRPNRGLSATLNEGFAKTSGDYFAYLGSDDLWLPEFLLERITLLEARGDAVLAHGNAFTIDTDGRVLENSADWKTYVDDDARPLLDRSLAPISSTVCYRRSALEKFKWNENSPLEDFERYLYLSYAGKFAFDPRVLSAWRRHDDNTSRDTDMMLREVLAAHATVAADLGLPQSYLKEVSARTSLEYSLLFARRGDTPKALSLLVKNWATAPDPVKLIKILGHCLLPARLKRAREERNRKTVEKRFKTGAGPISF